MKYHFIRRYCTVCASKTIITSINALILEDTKKTTGLVRPDGKRSNYSQWSKMKNKKVVVGYVFIIQPNLSLVIKITL